MSSPRPAVWPRATICSDLGAAEVISRDELSGPAKPLAKERWAGGVDAVGSHTLANVLSMTSYGGAVAACGLAQGMDLPTSVAPFILRGVSLLGIDSVMAPRALRLEAWRRIGSDLDHAKLAALSTTIRLRRHHRRRPRYRRGQGQGPGGGGNVKPVCKLYCGSQLTVFSALPVPTDLCVRFAPALETTAI